MYFKNKGFTLIELLVVIAIIGVLSSVVLASLNTARSKGNDAAVKSNLSNARSQAAVFYDVNGANGYLNICTNTSVASVKSIYAQVLGAANAAGLASFTRNAIGAAGTAVCNDTKAGWAAEVPLATSGTFFCVDSTGAAKIETANAITSTTDLKC